MTGLEEAAAVLAGGGLAVALVVLVNVLLTAGRPEWAVARYVDLVAGLLVAVAGLLVTVAGLVSALAWTAGP